MGFFDVIDKMNDIVWGPPLMIMLLGVGIALTIATGFFQFRYLGVHPQEDLRRCH